MITLFGALQVGKDAIFTKMTLKLPVKEGNRLHMVVASEIKEGLDLTLIAEATKSRSAGKSSPTISVPQYLEYVKHIKEFTKRIPVEILLNSNLSDQQNSHNAEYLSAVKSGDMKTAQKLVDEAAENAMFQSKIRGEDGKLLKVYHGTEAENFNTFDKNRRGQTVSSLWEGGCYG